MNSQRAVRAQVCICWCICVCVCDLVFSLGFKFLNIIIGSMQVHKHRTDGMYLLNDYSLSHQNKPCNRKRSPVNQKNRDKTFCKVSLYVIVDSPYCLHFSHNLPLVIFFVCVKLVLYVTTSYIFLIDSHSKFGSPPAP